MRKSRFQALLDQQHAVLKDLTASKGEEYANSNDDQLANFRRQAEELGLPMEIIWSVYFCKHIDSIKSFIRGIEYSSNITALDVMTSRDGTGLNVTYPKKMSEPIVGRIDDAILYLVLLKAMVVSHEEATYAP